MCVCVCVTLYRWSAKQTTPLSVLARNQAKGLDSRSRSDLTWGWKGRTEIEETASWKKEPTSCSWQSRPDSRRDQTA